MTQGLNTAPSYAVPVRDGGAPRVERILIVLPNRIRPCGSRVRGLVYHFHSLLSMRGGGSRHFPMGTQNRRRGSLCRTLVLLCPRVSIR